VDSFRSTYRKWEKDEQMKSIKEIIREVHKASTLEGEAYYTLDDLVRAIKFARSDVESEKKIEAHTKVSIDAYDKGVEHGKMFSKSTLSEPKGCGLTFIKTIGDFVDREWVCGKEEKLHPWHTYVAFCDKCREDTKEVTKTIGNVDWSKVDSLYLTCNSCNKPNVKVRGEGLYCVQCGNDLLEVNLSQDNRPKPLNFRGNSDSQSKTDRPKGVFIERAEPLTPEGIKAICMNDKDYEEHCKKRNAEDTKNETKSPGIL